MQRQVDPPEDRYADELALLAEADDGPRPQGWRLTPRAVVTFVCGGTVGTAKKKRVIEGKFVGERALVQRCVVTLAGERALLLVGEPGTAKSMLSELLAAAICGTSGLTVQGTAGTTEDQLRYGWNYAALLAQGPSRDALVASPILTAMEAGQVARVEEVTRCLPEVQDALVSLLSDRRISIPELAGLSGSTVHAAPGFTLIATANLRDRGVSEMSAALKRRFNFEVVAPIGDLAAEIALVARQARSALERVGAPFAVDDAVLEALVTAFRDLRSGVSVEGWAVERPSTVMSTAEAVAVASSLALSAAYFGDARGPDGGHSGDAREPDGGRSGDAREPDGGRSGDARGPDGGRSGDAREPDGGRVGDSRDSLRELPAHLLGVVRKDEPEDQGRLLAYWDGAVRRRAEAGGRVWRKLWENRDAIGA